MLQGGLFVNQSINQSLPYPLISTRKRGFGPVAVPHVMITKPPEISHTTFPVMYSVVKVINTADRMVESLGGRGLEDVFRGDSTAYQRRYNTAAAAVFLFSLDTSTAKTIRSWVRPRDILTCFCRERVVPIRNRNESRFNFVLNF